MTLQMRGNEEQITITKQNKKTNQKYTTKKEEKQNNTMVEWSKTLSQFDKRLGQGGILLRWVKISLVVNLFGICLHICILKIKIKLPWNKRFTIKKKSIKKWKFLGENLVRGAKVYEKKTWIRSDSYICTSTTVFLIYSTTNKLRFLNTSIIIW